MAPTTILQDSIDPTSLPSINDSDFTPATLLSLAIQTEPVFGTFYIVVLVLASVLSATMLLLLTSRLWWTTGSTPLEGVGRQIEEEENVHLQSVEQKPQIRRVRDEEKESTGEYPSVKPEIWIFEHRTQPSPVIEEEIEHVGDRGYTTGMQESLNSFDSLSSISTFKSEEDITEAEFQIQVVTQRLGKSNSAVKLLSKSLSEPGNGSSEVWRAVSHSFEIATARLVSVMLHPVNSRNDCSDSDNTLKGPDTILPVVHSRM